MDEPSDDARELIASYRRARVLDADARARVHARLLVSTEERASEPTPVRRRQLVTLGAIALASAATVMLAAQLLWGTGMRVAEAPRKDAATYEVDSGELPGSALVPATPPATMPMPIPMPDDESEPLQLAEPPVQRAAARPTAITTTSVTSAADALAAELARMHAARAALTRGDAGTALRELAAHERSGAGGQLVEERKALRVEALCLAGKRPQARAEAQLFARDYPRSTHRDRVANACTDAE